eukprot:COSAG05_NODE_6429_length_959_cov_3.224419_1_plen_59_part_10
MHLVEPVILTDSAHICCACYLLRCLFVALCAVSEEIGPTTQSMVDLKPHLDFCELARGH